MKNVDYKPPFPWFGGKSSVADIIWAGMGPDVKNYVEPFFGSGAVLFLRPGGAGPIETVNDADGMVSNFWRALRNDPDAVADAADWPVNEADLHARHLWLLGQRERITERLMGDPDFYDAKAAGWWCWGICCWMGSGWCCSGNGPWVSVNGELVLGVSGQGVSRQLPILCSPRGVVRKPSDLGGSGVWLRSYLGAFAERLSGVRVCCGDWSRVCCPSATVVHGRTGVFLDPPYADSANRTSNLYATDCEQVAHAVREWAIEQGTNPMMRVVLAGFEGEHDMPADWRVEAWKTGGSYASKEGSDTIGSVNKKRERLWFSPHCNRVDYGWDL